jgi:hypothetical protein
LVDYTGFRYPKTSGPANEPAKHDASKVNKGVRFGSSEVKEVIFSLLEDQSMAIHGNLTVGQTISMASPKILINGTELAGGLQMQDHRLSHYRNKAVVTGPATLTLTSTDANVHLHYTFNGRTPTSKSKEYTGPITLHQNSSGNGTEIKVRAFEYHNTNNVSLIIKGWANVIGGNTRSK